MKTGLGTDTGGSGGVAVGNAGSCVCCVGSVSPISDAVGVGAGDTTSGVGGDAASFVPKTNFSIALPSGLRFLLLISTLP